MISIGIDAYGGDNGYKEVIEAVKKYCDNFSDLKMYIYGNKEEIEKYTKEKAYNFNDNVVIVNANEEILMEEHPVFALRNKPNSSLRIATNDLVAGKISSLLSAGSTGALVALAQLYIKPLDNIKRPVVAAIIPTVKKPCLIIDSGSNMDPEPEWLYQYSIIGSVYMQCLFGIENPTVGLLNVGVEKTKGNSLVLKAYDLLSTSDKINFIGNVEAREVSSGICDVVCTDGFSGNILLKMYEGAAKNIISVVKNAMTSSFATKIGALLMKNTLKKTLSSFDAKKYGGAPILGARKLIVKCHGNAKYEEIYNAIINTKQLINNNITKKIEQKLGDNYGI